LWYQYLHCCPGWWGGCIPTPVEQEPVCLPGRSRRRRKPSRVFGYGIPGLHPAVHPGGVAPDLAGRVSDAHLRGMVQQPATGSLFASLIAVPGVDLSGHASLAFGGRGTPIFSPCLPPGAFAPHPSVGFRKCFHPRELRMAVEESADKVIAPFSPPQDAALFGGQFLVLHGAKPVTASGFPGLGTGVRVLRDVFRLDPGACLPKCVALLC
jgi:hypothetical protein